MIIQEITGLTEKLYLMMEVDEFRELLPGIPLSVTERKGHSAEGDAQRDSRLFGNHRIKECQPLFCADRAGIFLFSAQGCYAGLSTSGIMPHGGVAL